MRKGGTLPRSRFSRKRQVHSSRRTENLSARLVRRVAKPKLLAWNDNVRVTGVEEGIGELADSIAAVGLLQGLVVKKEPRGKYAVIAGRRRLLALSQLAADG